MRQRRFSIPTQFALAFLILLIVGIWFLRIPLCESFLQARLSAMGFTDAEFEVTYANPWRAEIENLQSVDGVRLKHGEMAIDWSTPLSPRLTTITLTGLELELSNSLSDSMWRDLGQAFKENSLNDGDNGSERKINLPEILVRNASAKISSADNSVVAEVSAPSFSLLPSLELDGSTLNENTKQTLDLKTELSVQSLDVRGSVMKDGFLSIAGRIERRDGQFQYKPHDCDSVRLKGLKKEQISVSGPVNACVSAGDRAFAVAIGRDGSITLDMLIESERALLDVNVSTLPSFPVEIANSSFSIRVSQSPTGAPVESIAFQAPDLVLPAAGISLEGVEVLAMTQNEEVHPRELLFDFDINQLRHLASPALLWPLAIEGKAEWSSEMLTVNATFQQSAQALNGMFHLHRDNDTGEGQADFNISPLDFVDGDLTVDDVSPIVARYFARLAGQVQASGKILFNDAWATPIQIEGTATDFIVSMKKAASSPVDETLAVDFGQTRLNLSLPPLSPEKGWATVNVVNGGLRLGDAELNDLTGTINLLSFSPLRCPGERGAETSETEGADGSDTQIANCLYESFAKDEPEPSQTEFIEAMEQFTNYLTETHLNQAPN